MLVAPSLSQIHSRFTHKHEAFHISRASHFENVFGKQTTEDLYDSGSENDSDGEDYYDLPELPGIHLAEIGPSRSPVARYDLCGSAMDVNTTAIGVGNILGWDEDTAEIAFYERPDPRTRKLVLVGVYPVKSGYVQLDLEQLAKKGKTCFDPLYIVPGGGFTLMRLLGLGWPRTRYLPG